MIFINVLLSTSYIYEYYSDLIIIWIAVFGNNNAVFSFFAVIFPLINRLMQIVVIIKLFVLGLKQFKKTVANERIDKHIILVNLFNVSKLLYPKIVYSQESKLLTILTIKECSLKLIQIILKLIIVTDVFENSCS